MQNVLESTAPARWGFLVAMIAATGYAFLPIFTRSLYSTSDLQPTDIAIWRYLFAVPVIWTLINLRHRPGKTTSRRTMPSWSRLLLLGIIYAGAALTAFIGLELITASIYVVLFFTYPTMVALISTLLGVRLSTRAWGAVCLTLVGIFLTIPDFNTLQGTSLTGILVALLNALIVAIYFIASSRIMQGIGSMGQGTAWIMTSTLLCMLCLLPFFGLTIPSDITTWLLLIGLAIFSTAMPLFMLNMGIQMIGAPKMAIITSIEPVMTMILALFLLNEQILSNQWLGVFAIVMAVLLLELKPRRKP